MRDAGCRMGGRVAAFLIRAGRQLQPRLDILMKNFLRLQPLGDHDDGAFGEKLAQRGGEKGLRGSGRAAQGQSASRLHAPAQVLHGGSVQGGGEPVWPGGRRGRGMIGCHASGKVSVTLGKVKEPLAIVRRCGGFRRHPGVLSR